MELRQLRYFVRIVETGSMGSAALDLDIGVSALSQQMTRLENELAIRLLQRTSRGVTPTNSGLAFYSQAQLALRHADDAILAAREDVYKRQVRNNPVLRHKLFQIDYLTTLSNQAVVSLLYHKKLDDEWRQEAEAPVSYTHLVLPNLQPAHG